MRTLSDTLAAGGSVLEQALAAWLPRRRWFRSKSRTLASVRVEAHAELGANDGGGPHFCVLEARFTEGEPESYTVPLVLRDRAEAEGLPEAAVIGALENHPGEILCDACWDPRFREALFDLLTGKSEKNLGEGVLSAALLPAADLSGARGTSAGSRLLAAEQSNTSFAYDSGHFVKLYRRLEQAVNPEPEVLRFLRQHTGYTRVPAFASSLGWTRAGSAPSTVALMQAFVAARGDAWEYALEALRSAPAGSSRPSESFGDWVGLLGRRVGELHAALASHPEIPDFAPEPLTAADLERTRAGTQELLAATCASLETLIPRLDPETAALAGAVLKHRSALEALLGKAAGAARSGVKTRTHGDLHLGQVLVAPTAPAEIPDVWILDFEGEPGRPLAEARRKQSPLRDVAGMLRSFHYAAHTVSREQGRGGVASALAEALGRRFEADYFAVAAHPGEPDDRDKLRDFFILEKTVYELHYELNNRPDWVAIPLRGLLGLAGR